VTDGYERLFLLFAMSIHDFSTTSGMLPPSALAGRAHREGVQISFIQPAFDRLMPSGWI
jgi:hypothetical protein